MKGIRIRLLPNRQQEKLMWKSAGTARWTWNWGVAFQQKMYSEEKRTLTEYDLKKEFTKIRNDSEFSWLKEVSRHVSVNALLDLGQSYKNFYRSLKQKNGRKVGLPRFKKAGSAEVSFCFNSDTVYDDGNGRLFLQKIGHVRYKSDQDLRGVRLWNTRVKFIGGKWLLCCAVEETSVEKPRLHEYSLGIDLGVKDLAVVSCNGRKRKFRNVNKTKRVSRLEKQLKHFQRELSRRKKILNENNKKVDSQNRKKSRKKVKRIYGRLKNIRKDYIHKVTTAIVEMLPSKIVMEDLNVQGMMKNHCLAKRIADQQFYFFRTCIEYKAEERGIKVVIADRFYPSSKTCSCCGSIKKDLKLSDRVYKCSSCGLEIDRDFNAARNLERLAG